MTDPRATLRDAAELARNVILEALDDLAGLPDDTPLAIAAAPEPCAQFRLRDLRALGAVVNEGLRPDLPEPGAAA